MIDASNRAGKSPVVTVYKSRKRKNSGSESISPGPYPYPPMPGHYTPPYAPEHHYGPMYSSYHNELSAVPPHYSPRSYGCGSDPHSMAPLPPPPSGSCSQMRPHPSSYGGSYRTPPATPSQPYPTHPSHPSMMANPGVNPHGYHSQHPSAFPYSAHSYPSHDGLPPHQVMDLHT